MKDKRVVDLKEFRDRAGRDERRSRQQLYPKGRLVQAAPRTRPASLSSSLPPWGGGAGRNPFDDGPVAA